MEPFQNLGNFSETTGFPGSGIEDQSLGVLYEIVEDPQDLVSNEGSG